MSIKHEFESPKADKPDATKVTPTRWNADHILEGGEHGYPLIRDLSSPDGMNLSKSIFAFLQVQFWTARATPNTNKLSGIAFSTLNSKMVATCSTGTGNRVITSDDGKLWVARTTPADQTWTSVCHSPSLNRWVAVSSTGSGQRVMTSDGDGVTWTLRNTPADNPWRSVCWSEGRGLYVAVASSGAQPIMTSPDGLTWTLRSAPAIAYYAVIWANNLGLFVTVGDTGTNRSATSSDGINWTARPVADDTGLWYGLCFSPELGLLVTCGQPAGGTHKRVATSTNGLTWTLQTAAFGADGLYCAEWSPELGLFAAAGGSSQLMTSPNGEDWTVRYPSINNAWVGMIFNPEIHMFVVVGNGTLLGNVMTSTPLTVP